MKQEDVIEYSVWNCQGTYKTEKNKNRQRKREGKLRNIHTENPLLFWGLFSWPRDSLEDFSVTYSSNETFISLEFLK